MALPYRQRVERERDRLIDAQLRLLSDSRRHPGDVRIARGRYVTAADFGRYQRLSRELEAVEAKLAELAPAARGAAEQAPVTNHEQEEQSVELRTIPIDDIRVLEGHNARAEVGDVAELADSIRAHGVLQALTVEQLPAAAGDGQAYALIAGERRLTAARQAGLTEVPCVVRHGLDERARTAAMLVENLQRQDLAPLEEAAGLRRLVELGLSQREIGRQLGRSQGHVSKRLALLELPEEVKGALSRPGDAGGITVVEALELTKLAGHPGRQADAFGRRGAYGGLGGLAWLVKGHLQELERERARAEALSRLSAAGIPVLKEQSYRAHDPGTRPLEGQGLDYAAVGLTAEEHQGQPCHAAAVDRDGKVVYVCRDPSRHADVDPGTAAQIARSRREEERQRAHERLRREAARGRRQAMERVLAGANTSQLPFAAHQVLASWRVSESKRACDLLDLQAPGSSNYGSADYCGTLAEYASGSMAAAIRALLALALATGEERVAGNWGNHGGLGRRHLELLVAAGYKPNRSDRRHLTTKPKPDPDGGEAEERCCRGCGCSEREPCHGGCEWVEDPEGLGDLCSRCLDESDESDETAAEMVGEQSS